MSVAKDNEIKLLKRKLAKRDRRIAGMEREIRRLEHLITLEFRSLEDLPRQIETAVTRALCNVRMIPVLGAGRDARILEVNSVPVPKS